MVFILFHIIVGPHKFKHPVTCHHVTESLVSHSQTDPQPQPHIITQPHVSHTPANMVIHSHSYAVWQAYHFTHYLIQQSPTHLPSSYCPLIYSSNMVPLNLKDIYLYTVSFILSLTVSEPQSVIHTIVSYCRSTHLQMIHTVTKTIAT